MSVFKELYGKLVDYLSANWPEEVYKDAPLENAIRLLEEYRRICPRSDLAERGTPKLVQNGTLAPWEEINQQQSVPETLNTIDPAAIQLWNDVAEKLVTEQQKHWAEEKVAAFKKELIEDLDKLALGGGFKGKSFNELTHQELLEYNAMVRNQREQAIKEVSEAYDIPPEKLETLGERREREAKSKCPACGQEADHVENGIHCGKP